MVEDGNLSLLLIVIDHPNQLNLQFEHIYLQEAINFDVEEYISTLWPHVEAQTW